MLQEFPCQDPDPRSDFHEDIIRDRRDCTDNFARSILITQQVLAE